MNTALILLLLTTGFSNDPEYSNDRMFRSAKIVQLLVSPGESIHAGPLTLLIDPTTHKAVKRVTPDPKKNPVILAIQRKPGKRKGVGIFMIRPVTGRARKAVFRSVGGESHIVVPDDLGNRAIKERTFWIRGTSEGKKMVQNIGFYDVIAYTAKDAFFQSTLPFDEIEFIGWKDESDEEKTEVEAEGIDIQIEPPPPTKKGKEYEIKGTVTGPGESEEEIVLWIAYSEGAPKIRRQVVELKKQGKDQDPDKKKEKEDDRPERRDPRDPVDHAFEFVVIAKTGPAERNLIRTAKVNKEESDLTGNGTVLIEEWNPLQKFPGKVKKWAKEFSPFNDGGGPDPTGTLFRQVVIAGTATFSGIYPRIFTYLDPSTGKEVTSTRSAIALHEKDKEELIQIKVYFDELPPIDSEEGNRDDSRVINPDGTFTKPD